MLKVGRMEKGDEVLVADAVLMPYAYVIQQKHKDAAVKLIRDYLLENDVITIGRFGEWSYYNTDHAILAGKRAAEQVQTLRERSRPGVGRSSSVVAALTGKKLADDGAALTSTGKI